MRLSLWVFTGICLLVGSSCATNYHKLSGNYHIPGDAAQPDYSNLDFWAAHPAKKDPADSIPRPLRRQLQDTADADVFFIHPTTYTEKEKSLGWNAPVSDAVLAAKTDYSTILFQASAFNAAGRIFAPRYRQANLDAYFPKNAADTNHALAAFDTAYADVKAAFLYYLEHENKGRPILIAAHSQGSTHGKRLLKEFFDGKPLQQQLVAAYLVGMAVEPDWFSNIPPCDSPSQTGCVCSWRTFKAGYKPDYVAAEPFTALVTNPLTWIRDKPNAPRKANRGAVLTGFNQVIKRVAEARVEQGVIWTRRPHFFGSFLIRNPNYHVGDINLYYLSVRENALMRVRHFLKK